MVSMAEQSTSDQTSRSNATTVPSILPKGDRPSKRTRATDTRVSNLPSTDDEDIRQSSRASSSRRAPQAVAVGKTARPKPLLSCGECRRLKLKCDRVFPCKSCVKRGCEGICPDGSLTTGKGSRYILANTEQLHDKIVQMSERIRSLEEALDELNSKHSAVQHPLLKRELLLIKTSLELYGLDPAQAEGAVAEESGHEETLPQTTGRTAEAAGDNFFGITARPEERIFFFLPPNILEECRPIEEMVGDLELARLATSTPATWLTRTAPPDLRRRLRDALPLREVAVYLCGQVRKYACWQYIISPSDAFEAKLIEEVYTAPADEVSTRRLALLYSFLSLGSCADADKKPGVPQAERYHLYARVALCEGSVIYDPDMTVVQCLFMILWSLLIFASCKRGTNDAWAFMGVAAKVVQGLGLHRDSGESKDTIHDFEERQMIFWELLNLDTRLSLTLGRPPSFSFLHTDRRRPTYRFLPYIDAQYHGWKHSFLQECLHPLLELSTSITAPDYIDVLRLDTKIRDFPQPNIFDEREQPTLSLHMQRAMSTIMKEISLLQLHRSFYTRTLSDGTGASLAHRYAPSIVATFRSACKVIDGLERVYKEEPALSARFAVLWFNGFSGIIALCLLVSRSPSSSLAPCALKVLDRASNLYAAASPTCYNAKQSQSRINSLVAAAKSTYIRWRHSVHLPLGAPAPFEPGAEELLSELENKMRHVDEENKRGGASGARDELANYWGHVHLSLFEYYKEVTVGFGGVGDTTGVSWDISTLLRPTSFPSGPGPSSSSQSQAGGSLAMASTYDEARLRNVGMSRPQDQGHNQIRSQSIATTHPYATTSALTTPSSLPWTNPLPSASSTQPQPPLQSLALPLQMPAQPQTLPILPTAMGNIAFDGTVSFWNGSFRASTGLDISQVGVGAGIDESQLQPDISTSAGTVNGSGYDTMPSTSISLFDPNDPLQHPQFAQLVGLGADGLVQLPLVADDEQQMQYTTIQESSHTDPLMFNEYSASTQWMDWL